MSNPLPSTSSSPIYAAVIDAGSSGTRIFLYKIIPGSYPVVEKLIEKEFFVMPSGAKEDGINNFVAPDNPDKQRRVGPETIQPLLMHVKQFLAGIGVTADQVEVHLFATAGMRYAQQQHGTDAIESFYRVLKEVIHGAGFVVGEARTIDGNSEEGIWTWVNLNDVCFNVFQTTACPVGIIEVGGSSAQFSYPIMVNVRTHDDCGAALHDELTDDTEGKHRQPNIYRISVNGRTYDVFCKTYLGLGQDDARKAMRHRVGAQQSAVCFPTGFSAVSDAGDVLDGVATFQLGADGIYDYHQCTSNYDGIIEELLSQEGRPDLLKGGDFVGVEGAYYATRYWDIHHDPIRLASEIMRHCHDVANFDGIDNNEHLQFQAANATYINALLFGRHGLFRSQPQKFVKTIPSKEGEDTKLTWTRGFLLMKYASSLAA